jgi:TonB family protein
MLKRRIEGWVQVGFVVAEDGSTRDIRIINNSEELSFDSAAINAVSKWKFEPATWNGKPVPEFRMRQRIVFIIESEKTAVSKKFKSRLKHAYAAIREGDLNRARELIDALERNKQYRLSEDCWIDTLEGDYWKAIGNKQKALRHYKRAELLADDFTSAAAYKQLLRKVIYLNAELNRLASALHYHQILIDFDPGLPDDDAVNELAQRIRQYIESDQPYVTRAEIKPPCSTCAGVEPTLYHKLLRDRVTVTDVEGSLSELRFLCGTSYLSVAYVLDTVWDINKDWGECVLQVMGDPGTTFSVVEL